MQQQASEEIVFVDIVIVYIVMILFLINHWRGDGEFRAKHRK